MRSKTQRDVIGLKSAIGPPWCSESHELTWEWFDLHYTLAEIPGSQWCSSYEFFSTLYLKGFQLMWQSNMAEDGVVLKCRSMVWGESNGRQKPLNPKALFCCFATIKLPQRIFFARGTQMFIQVHVWRSIEVWEECLGNNLEGLYPYEWAWFHKPAFNSIYVMSVSSRAMYIHPYVGPAGWVTSACKNL